MVQVDGLRLLLCWALGLASNAEKDGIIILLRMLLNKLGVMKKNGDFIFGMLSMETSGPRLPRNLMAELITLLKIIGIRP